MLIRRIAGFLFASILILLQCFAGDGSASGTLDGSFPLENGTTTMITGYYRNDQCMAQPGYFHIHHNSLVFFLEEHQFCGGGPYGTEGLLVCYKGQLDKMELLRRGLQPDRQFELSNLPGNAVTKRCEDAGHPGWHGMLIYTNDQGEWVFRFSTTNRMFVIHGKRLEMLVLKLASAKDGGESFLSKIFGPKRDFMDWGRRESFGLAEEAANRIRHAENEQLWELFQELVKHQAPLREYVGIWSLGLDMLPTDENIHHLELYIKKSECCADIQVFFNLPTAELPEFGEKKVNLTKEDINIEANFPENFEGVLDGVVDQHAQNITFEILDLFQPKGKVQGMKLTVNFAGNNITLWKKIEYEWKETNKTTSIKNHFGKGQPFHLVFILGKDGLRGNMNCYGFLQLLESGEIVFGNIHRIKIYGDFQLAKGFEFPPFAFNNSWMIVNDKDGQIIHGISEENSDGIVLRGKVSPNAKSFSIKLYNKGADEDGFFVPILELEVGISLQGFYISKGEDQMEKLSAKEPTYNEDSSFEAVILFDGGIFDIWMNNTPIYGYEIPAELRVVNYVQILGDATGNLIQLPKTPMESETIQMTFENTCALNIVAKVLVNNGFQIGLKSGVENSVPLLVDVKFSGHNSVVKLIETTGTGVKNRDTPPKFEDLIKIGEDFHLKFQYLKNQSEILVAINGADHIFTSKSQFVTANQYTISEGVIILDVQFSAPCPCVPSMCPSESKGN